MVPLRDKDIVFRGSIAKMTGSNNKTDMARIDSKTQTFSKLQASQDDQVAEVEGSRGSSGTCLTSGRQEGSSNHIPGFVSLLKMPPLFHQMDV